ncbi:hypothetical protein WEI85_05230 [Actinomycetes bacterium KLBMP 9797]
MRVTIGMKVTFVAAAGLMSLAWIAAVPADPPRPTDSPVVLVIEQPDPAAYDCPFA